VKSSVSVIAFTATTILTVEPRMMVLGGKSSIAQSCS
jgi:hypothetical protein